MSKRDIRQIESLAKEFEMDYTLSGANSAITPKIASGMVKRDRGKTEILVIANCVRRFPSSGERSDGHSPD